MSAENRPEQMPAPRVLNLNIIQGHLERVVDGAILSAAFSVMAVTPGREAQVLKDMVFETAKKRSR